MEEGRQMDGVPRTSAALRELPLHKCDEGIKLQTLRYGTGDFCCMIGVGM